MFKLQVAFETITPLHVSGPGEERDDQNIPGSSHASESFFNSETGLSYSVPVVPTNDVAGRLRKAGQRNVLRALAAKEEKADFQLAHALSPGSSVGSMGDRNLQLSEIRAAHQNVFTGLFGGGDRLFPRKWQILACWPYCDGYPGGILSRLGLRPQLLMGRVSHRFPQPKAPAEGENVPIDRKTAYLPVTERVYIRRMDFALSGDLSTHGEMAETIANYEENREKWLERSITVSGQRQRGDAKKDTKLETYTFFRAVGPGTVFVLLSEIHSDDQAHLGLALLAMRDMLAQPIGGLVRNGYGRVRVVGSVVVPTNGAWAEESSAIVDGDGGPVLSSAAANCDKAVKQAEDRIASLSASTLRNLLVEEPKSKADKTATADAAI